MFLISFLKMAIIINDEMKARAEFSQIWLTGSTVMLSGHLLDQETFMLRR